MKPTWFVKRRPTGMSFFRDGFPYLESFQRGGSMWAQTRAEVQPFRSLKEARRALKVVRRLDRHTMIVRVTT